MLSNIRNDIPIKLDGEALDVMPIHALLQVKEVTVTEQRLSYSVQKPKGDGVDIYLIGGPVEMTFEGEGAASRSYGARVQYDDNGGTDIPQIGETWGGQDDSWKLHKNGSLGTFLILGDLGGDTEHGPTIKTVRVAFRTGNLQTVLIAETIEGAGWVPGGAGAEWDGELTVKEGEAWLLKETGEFTRRAGQGTPPAPITVVNEYKSAIAIGTDKARVAHCIDDIVINLDCEEVSWKPPPIPAMKKAKKRVFSDDPFIQTTAEVIPPATIKTTKGKTAKPKKG